MIQASINALSGLIPAFLILSLLVVVPVMILARSKGWPVVSTALWAASLVGVLTVTLIPGSAGDAATSGECFAGPTLSGVLTTTPGRLNVLLFVPVSFFGVLGSRRPILTLAGSVSLAFGVELTQALLPLGRSCSFADIHTNLLGALTGALCAVAWVWVKSRRQPFTPRDTVRGLSALAAAVAISFVAFQVAVTPMEGGAEAVGPSAEQDRWAREVAADLYGDDARIIQVQAREEMPGLPGRLDVTTDKGTLNLVWPEKRIQAAFSKDNQDDNGSLSQKEAQEAGESFAKKWYHAEIKGSKKTFDPLGNGNGPYILSYRRYEGDVMMPLRLDITVTSAGRIMGVNTRLVPDPDLPRPVLRKEDAQKIAEKTSGFTAVDPSFMIAQEVNTVWRPVWIVNLIRKGEKEAGGAALYVDAISGDIVQKAD